MSQTEILNFIMNLDHQVVAAAAVLLLLVLLFWRVLSRTSRIEREVARLGERLERIREEVRSGMRPGPLSVAPVKEAPALLNQAVSEPEPAPETESAVDRPEEDDVLSRAVASLAEEGPGEPSAEYESDDSFFFDAEPNDLSSQVEEPLMSDPAETFSYGDPEELPAALQEPAAEEPAAEQPAAEQPAAETVSGAGMDEAASGVARLEGDPSRPGVSMVRCLSCNYKLAYPEKLAGKRVRCPSCRASLNLP